jgi:large subunit ribosomal protein L7/L12
MTGRAWIEQRGKKSPSVPVGRVRAGRAAGDGDSQVEAEAIAKLEALQLRLAQLKMRQVRLEARERSLASHRARKLETRRKILVGAVVLNLVERGELEESVLRRWLSGALTRKDDRELFGL